jgi:hypothetical protein
MPLAAEGIGVLVCAAAHMAESGRDIATNVGVRELIPSNVTRFSITENKAVYATSVTAELGRGAK